MITRTIRDRIFDDVTGAPSVNAPVVFDLPVTGSSSDGQFLRFRKRTVWTDLEGWFETQLAVNSTWSNQAPIRCILPDGDRIEFYLSPGSGQLTLDDLRLAGDPPPSTALAQIQAVADDLAEHIADSEAHSGGGGQPGSFVLLQSVSPGTQQPGNCNLSGTGVFGRVGIGGPPSGIHNKLTVGPTPTVVNNAVSVFSIPETSAGNYVVLFTRELDGFPLFSVDYYGNATFSDLVAFYGGFRCVAGNTRIRRLGIGDTTGPASMQVWQHCERISPEFGTVPANGETALNITVSGAAYNDCVEVYDLDGVTQPGIRFVARVTAANTVQLKALNSTAAPLAVMNGGFALVLRRFE